MGQLTPLFARQPIFDRDLQAVAYELLFRNNAENAANIINGDQASSHVLLYAFGQHNIEDIIGNVPAYINFTRQLLVYPPALPPHQLVVEILEDVKPDERVLDSLKTLKSQGYKIALDDFTINESSKAFIKYADIIKIDVMAISKETISKYVRHLKPLKITLLAEKIETQEMFEYCLDLDFDLFQGYFLQKPNTIEGVKLCENKHSILRLLMTLTSSDVRINEIVEAIASDPKLSFRILKIVNSTVYQFACEIHSLNQAVTMLGLNQIRNWATFLVLSSDRSKPAELCILGTNRAKFCELIGAEIGDIKLAESCFAVGIMSTFDAFLDMTIEEVISHLGLAPEMKLALMEKKGIIGEILDLSLAIERADWETTNRLRKGKLSTITDEQLNTFYSNALVWSQEIAADFT